MEQRLNKPFPTNPGERGKKRKGKIKLKDDHKAKAVHFIN